ncbi:uncharacterized protein LOC125504464 [Dendroctonus ponderosae]|uniref:uncharacterized protein LOC125504464 n=1 Tax=Dendroctonus ponderosae TaxID=77166 RepID=UPI002034A917|nr:uncharacterized protein LOC125504464 [Dendroctonus ponderosae]
MSSRERSPSGSESEDSNASESQQGKPARRPPQKPRTLLSFKAKTKAADLQSLRLANSKLQESVTSLKKQNQLLAHKLTEQDHKIALLLSAVAEAQKQALPKAPSSHAAEKMEVDDFPPLKAKPRLNIPKTSNPALHEHMVQHVQAPQPAKAPQAAPAPAATSALQPSGPATTSAPQTPKSAIPIVIRNTAEWTKARNLLVQNNCTFTNPKKVALGIQIHPKTTNDHRAITKLLAREKI